MEISLSEQEPFMTRNLRLVVFATLAFTTLCTSLAWAGLVAENQCPGDCSPCLGPSDPFCTSGGGSSGSGTTGGSFCVRCESARGNCRDALRGETGKNQSCTVITEGTTVISCTATGSTCQGTSVTP